MAKFMTEHAHTHQHITVIATIQLITHKVGIEMHTTHRSVYVHFLWPKRIITSASSFAATSIENTHEGHCTIHRIVSEVNALAHGSSNGLAHALRCSALIGVATIGGITRIERHFRHHLKRGTEHSFGLADKVVAGRTFTTFFFVITLFVEKAIHLFNSRGGLKLQI